MTTQTFSIRRCPHCANSHSGLIIGDIRGLDAQGKAWTHYVVCPITKSMIRLKRPSKAADAWEIEDVYVAVSQSSSSPMYTFGERRPHCGQTVDWRWPHTPEWTRCIYEGLHWDSCIVWKPVDISSPEKTEGLQSPFTKILAELRSQATATDEERIAASVDEFWKPCDAVFPTEFNRHGLAAIIRKHFLRQPAAVDCRERTFSEENPPVGMVIEVRHPDFKPWRLVRYLAPEQFAQTTIWRPVTLPIAEPAVDCRWREPGEVPSEGLQSPFTKILAELQAMHDRKQADYGTDEDPLANVRASDEFGIEPWHGVFIRLNDKITRLKTFAKKRTLKNESVEDNLIDVAVYAIIALQLFRESQLAPHWDTAAGPEPKPPAQPPASDLMGAIDRLAEYAQFDVEIDAKELAVEIKSAVSDLQAERDKLLDEQCTLEQWQTAAREWLAKTEWVQNSEFEFSTIGMHRADVLRKEIERLTALVSSPEKTEGDRTDYDDSLRSFPTAPPAKRPLVGVCEVKFVPSTDHNCSQDIDCEVCNEAASQPPAAEPFDDKDLRLSIQQEFSTIVGIPQEPMSWPQIKGVLRSVCNEVKESRNWRRGQKPDFSEGISRVELAAWLENQQRTLVPADREMGDLNVSIGYGGPDARRTVSVSTHYGRECLLRGYELAFEKLVKLALDKPEG